MNIRKAIFFTTHRLVYPSFPDVYRDLMATQWLPTSDLENIQNDKLGKMIRFAYEEIPYYRKLFEEFDLKPSQIQTKDDLNKLPILTKEIISKNWADFMPKRLKMMKYSNVSTGGTTGTGFTFRLHQEDHLLSIALRYRGWSFAGYEPGDRIVFFGGASIVSEESQSLKNAIRDKIINIKRLSSFDMADNELEESYKAIIKFKPKFLRGYPSSIHLLANWIKEHGLQPFDIQACFTTSEQLFDNVRKDVSSIFGCKVFNTYGLNDGGVSFYECSEGNLHVDMERSVLEVVNENSHQGPNGVGKILATSLANWAMPFFRYDTGDLGMLDSQPCSCGRGLPLLKSIEGRTTDIFITPEGKRIHGWFFLYIFWKYAKTVKNYQVVQVNSNDIVIKIVPNKGFGENVVREIKEIVWERSQGWKVSFEFVEKIEPAPSGKMIYIMNLMESNKNQHN
jgi:phenylacetate-CoA ligase